MRCPACQFENPAGMRFCGQCVSALVLRCPQCGAEVPGGFRFCGQCGASLQATPPHTPPPPEPAARQSRLAAYTPKHLAEKILKGRSVLEGERRQVTVLFADLDRRCGRACQGPSRFRSLDSNRAPWTRPPESFSLARISDRGQDTGDSVMALFGAPIAHEDSPRRAVHAALGIQRALRDYNKELQLQRGLTLQMRIGIHAGPVVVGRIGDDLRMD